MIPKKSLGQHFLLDREAIERMLDLVEVKRKKVLEIGAGTGVVTEAIAARRPKKLVAIEIDEEAASKARERTGNTKNVDIIIADARSFPFEGYDVIVGSIPYYLSSHLVFRAIKAGAPTVFVVQKEFADRLVAEPGTSEWGRLSVMAQAKASVTKAFDISRFSFYPPPEVDSAVVLLKPKKTLPLNEQLVTALFSHKNQTVRNAFRHSARALGLTKEQAKKTSIPFQEKRVRDLTLDELVELSAAWKAF